jgi:hypothetical protein
MPVKKGILNTKMYTAFPNFTGNHVLSVPKGVIELKNITIILWLPQSTILAN